MLRRSRRQSASSEPRGSFCGTGPYLAPHAPQFAGDCAATGSNVDLPLELGFVRFFLSLSLFDARDSGRLLDSVCITLAMST